jgi:uncharacterized membrane protein YebE (DUF533 family)
MLDKVINAAIRGGLSNVLKGAGVGGRRGSGGALGGVAGQAALAAAVGMLLRRGGAGRLVKVGGVAALGMMAYKAWQEYQARQGGGGAVPGTMAGKASVPSAPTNADDDTGDAQQQALLVAMIAAAKSDGHVDDQERAQIEQVLREAGGDAADVLAWFDAELKRPLDAAAVAQPAANDPDLASKIYLASAIVVGGGDGQVTAPEQAWLDSLGRALRLPDGLAASLRKQAEQLA